ncbi:MAG: aspartyl protease family protein [Pseudomonadota bacterium]|nr:aspartyl protease family protein [Pseudomonadota bacterium]
MRNIPFMPALMALTLCSAAAATAATPAQILAANKAATGGAAWNGKAALKLDFAYTGQGLKGKVEELVDLSGARYVEHYDLGVTSGAEGFDGSKAWSQDASGTVTIQNGGNQRQIAVSEAYRDANLWWRADFGGAAVRSEAGKSADGHDYNVLRFTPKDGNPFDAWFDAKTNLLYRVVEIQGTQTITVTISGYKTIDGAALPASTRTSTGDKKYDQLQTLQSATFLPAQPDAAFAPPKVTVADFAIAGGANQTSFPFQLINNHIYADARVNGKGPYLFIFDTGGVNLVTPPTAWGLGLAIQGKMQASGAGSGHMQAGLTKVSSLTLGDATISNQVFVVLPLNDMSNVEGLNETGMVGFETFRRFVTRIDYGAHTITLIAPGAFDPKDAGTPVHLAFNERSIEAQASYDGVTGNFTIDTGSRAALTLNGPFVATNGLRAKAGKGVEAVDGWGVGGPSHAFVSRGRTLTLGGYAIKGPVVEMSTDKGGAFADAAIAGNIGAGILKRFVVTLDYGHSLMYLKPVAGSVADLDTYDRAGMWINAGAKGFKVVDVTEGSPAAKAGLKKDDVITAVDGTPADEIKLYDLRQRLRDDDPGTEIYFTVMRGGTAKMLEITLENQI